MPSGDNNRRTDWTVPDLMARWGQVMWRHDLEIFRIGLTLPYPANKDPVMEEWCEAHGIKPGYVGAREGWARGGHNASGRKYARPQTEWHFDGAVGYAFAASIDWRCGHERKDRALATWRRWAERRNIRVALNPH